MTVLLDCTRCGGNIRPLKYNGCRVCDVDGHVLTPEYREKITENGCSFFTLRSIPRRESKYGNHPLGVSDVAYQIVSAVPKGVVNPDTKLDDGKPFPFEYEAGGS
jgi:hypothetical protein